MATVYIGFFKQTGDKIPSSVGHPLKLTRSVIRDERGNIKVLLTGTTDLQKQIQSYESGCDIHNIVKRALVDESLLNFNPELFGGSNHGMPSDMRGILDYLNSCRDKYASLPPDVASRFSSFDDFVTAFHDENRLDDVLACFGKKRSVSDVKVGDSDVKKE